MPIKLGQGVVFRPGTAHDERWAPSQLLSGMVTNIQVNEASLLIFPDGYPPYYETRVVRNDALAEARSWTPAVGEDQTLPEAPTDGKLYGRRNQAWHPIIGEEDLGYIQSIVISDIPPASPLVGMAWFDTTINNFYIFEQGFWVEPGHINPAPGLNVPTAPLNTVPPLIQFMPPEFPLGVNSEVLANEGGWSSPPPIEYDFQWMRAGIAIPGAVSNLYLLVAEDNGQNLYCLVTATNAVGATAAPSNILPIVFG